MAKTKKTSSTKQHSEKKEGAAKQASSAAAETAAEPAMDRRSTSNDRRRTDRRQKSVPVAVERRKVERRVKVSRRRQIDPTTCERDYHEDEVEFMNALDLYKRTSGRMFPTCSEILEVIRGLGYEKRPPVPVAEQVIPSTEVAPTTEPVVEQPIAPQA